MKLMELFHVKLTIFLLLFITSCATTTPVTVVQAPSASVTAKQYTFYTDVHMYNRKSQLVGVLPVTVQQVISENAYSLGDNWDFLSARKKECPAITVEYAKHTVVFAGRFVVGNHEDRDFTNLDKVVDGHVLLTHGDYAIEGSKKAVKLRSMKKCHGYGMIQDYLASHGNKMSVEEANKLAEYALKFKGVDVIVSGHLHNDVIYDSIVKGIRVISLPRGKTVISL